MSVLNTRETKRNEIVVKLGGTKDSPVDFLLF